MRPYEERRATRIARLYERAEAKRREAAALETRASQMADVIPLGQPILVGHHSERRDRRYRERIHGTFLKSYEAGQQAQQLARRAAAAESSRAVSSDDPEAVARLQEKLAALVAEHARYAQINKAVRAKDPRAALAALGVSASLVEQLLTPDFAGRLGIPGYKLTNSSAEIRRLKQRIEQLTARAAAPEREPETVGDVRIEESENRVRLYFPGKPPEAVRADLKGHGFRWSPTEGAWQRMASEQAWYHARRIAGAPDPTGGRARRYRHGTTATLRLLALGRRCG